MSPELVFCAIPAPITNRSRQNASTQRMRLVMEFLPQQKSTQFSERFLGNTRDQTPPLVRSTQVHRNARLELLAPSEYRCFNDFPSITFLLFQCLDPVAVRCQEKNIVILDGFSSHYPSNITLLECSITCHFLTEEDRYSTVHSRLGARSFCSGAGFNIQSGAKADRKQAL